MVGWQGWSVVWWLLFMFCALIAEGIVGKMVASKMKDEAAGKIAAYGIESAAGAAICAIASFDMRLIQVEEGYYVEDVLRRYDTGLSDYFYTIELTRHGFYTAMMLAIGAVWIVAGAVGIVLVLYKKGVNGEAQEEPKEKRPFYKPKPVETPNQTPGAPTGAYSPERVPAWKRVQQATNEGTDVVICPKCGTSQRPDRTVCYNCGTKFQEQG